MMQRTMTAMLMSLVAFVMSSAMSVSATDYAIRCPGNSAEEIELSAMNILSVCLTHLNTSETRLEEGARIFSLDGALFHHEIALEILRDRQFWVTYCRDWPQFESCALNAVRNCTSSEVDLLRKEVKTQTLKVWRSIGLFPVPIMEKWACNGPEVSDRLRNVYDYEKSKGCDVDLVKECLLEWLQDLQNSGFLETTEDASTFNKTDWLIRKARLILNCSRMYLKPCTSKKVVEFVNFVIKQSIPLELAKQVFDDVDKTDEIKNEVYVGVNTSSSSSCLQIYTQVSIIICFGQIVLLALRGTVAHGNTYDSFVN